MPYFDKKNLFFVILGVCSALVAILLYLFDSLFNFQRVVLILWLIGIIFPLVPLVPYLLNKLKFLKPLRKEFLFILLLALVSLFLRFYKLQQIPFFNGDEARDAGFLPESFLKGQINDYFGYNVYGISNIFIIFTSISHLWFGHTILAVRFFAAVFGTLSVLMVYFVAKTFYGLRIGIIASILIAFSQVHFQFSRSEFINNFDSFWAPLVFLLLLYAVNKKEIIFSYLLGLTIGLATHFYQGIRAALLFSLVSFIAYNMAIRKSKTSIKKITGFVFGFFLAFGPTLVIAITRSNEFLNTGSSGNFLSILIIQSGSVFNGLLAFIKALPNRFLFSFGSIIYYPIDFHYRYGGSLLQFPANFLFLVGIFFVLRKILSFKYFVLLGWVVSVVFFNSILTENMNFAHRFLSLLPGTIIIAAIGLEGLVSIIKKDKIKKTIIVFFLLSSILINLKVYFIDQVWQKVYDTNTKVAIAAGYYSASLPPEKIIYFLNSPRMGWKSGSNWEYLSPNAQVKDCPDKELLILLEQTMGLNNGVFIALPEREEDLRKVVQKWPDGVEKKHIFYGSEILFTSYELK